MELTLSNPAMFLFSAKNSAGDSTRRKTVTQTESTTSVWLPGKQRKTKHAKFLFWISIFLTIETFPASYN